MFAIALTLLLSCQPQAELKDQAGVSIDGLWHIVGNEYHGTLELKVSSENTLTGKIYGQKIEGKWNPNDKRFEFTRFQLEKGIQYWEGELKTDVEAPNAPWVLSGKFSSVAGPYFGEDDKSYAWTGKRLGKDGLYVGMPALASVVAKFVSGEKAGKTMCPILLESEETKIAIFAKQLNAPVLKLIQSVEQMVAVTPKLKSSFVFLSHENAPTPTEAEYEEQLGEIKRLATENAFKHLSMGLMIRIPFNHQMTRARPSLGFFGDGDFVVMLISPEKDRDVATIRYFQVFNSDVKESEIERVSKELKSTFDGLEKSNPPGAIGLNLTPLTR